MNTLLMRLLDILRKQTCCTGHLLKLSKAEREAIKVNDVQELLAICKKITTASLELAELEEERVEVHCQAARELGLAEDIRLKDLWKFESSEAVLLRVRKGSSCLDSSYIELQHMNETNQLLLRQASAFASAMLNALEPEGRLTYSKDGNVYHSRLVSSFVNRTV